MICNDLSWFIVIHYDVKCSNVAGNHQHWSGSIQIDPEWFFLIYSYDTLVDFDLEWFMNVGQWYANLHGDLQWFNHLS